MKIQTAATAFIVVFLAPAAQAACIADGILPGGSDASIRSGEPPREIYHADLFAGLVSNPPFTPGFVSDPPTVSYRGEAHLTPAYFSAVPNTHELKEGEDPSWYKVPSKHKEGGTLSATTDPKIVNVPDGGATFGIVGATVLGLLAICRTRRHLQVTSSGRH